jgi:hypothetical protein
MLGHLSTDDQRSATTQLRMLWKEVFENAGFTALREDGDGGGCLWGHPLSATSFSDPYTPASLFRAVRARLADGEGSGSAVTPATFRQMSRVVRAMAWDQAIDWKLRIEAEASSRLTGSHAERTAQREVYRRVLWEHGDDAAPHRVRSGIA